MINQLEEQYGFKFDSLRVEEQAEFLKMLEDVQKASLTPERMHAHVVALRESVERELVNEPEFNFIFIFRVPNRKQIFLKARLANYLLLESFLHSPQRAKAALDDALANLGRKVSSI